MRILHVNNLAAVPGVLAREQRRRGHEVTVAGLNNPPSFKVDVEAGAARIKYAFSNYDVIHLHSCSLAPFYLDAPLTRLLGKKTVYHHHGSDVRGRGYPLLSRLHSRHLVATPDLLQWCSGAKWLPNPVDLKEFKASRRPKKFKVAYGYKDAATISREIKGFDSTLIHGMPFGEAMKELSKCSVFVDNYSFGTYSYLATQAMALGKPVVCRLSDESLRVSGANCVINSTARELRGVIGELRASPKEAARSGKACREFVERVHDVKKVCDRLEEAYQ